MSENTMLLRPVLAGQQCRAEYVEQIWPDYKNNPLIEALPEVYDPRTVATLLTEIPEHTEDQRTWDARTRMHCIQQIKDFMQPLPFHIGLEDAVSKVLRYGYKARNPMSPLFARQFTKGFREVIEYGLNQKGENITGNRPTASGFAIVGLSGTGKSTAIERVLLLYPQVLVHTEYKGKPFVLKQLVWLKLECPANGSIKSLCQNFFKQVDFVLGTNYYKKHATSGATAENMLISITHVAALHGLGVLVIDEVQRLKRASSGGEQVMLNFFTELINTIGIPVILIGTYASSFLFESTFAEARRATGQGDQVISQMEDDSKWRLFLEGLWELQWTTKATPLTDELARRMYIETQGIADIAVKLYMNVQWEAIVSGVEEVTPALIRRVAEKSLKFVRKALDALHTGNQDVLKAYEDLELDWLTLKDYLEKSEEDMVVEGRIAAEHKRSLQKKNQDDTLVEFVGLGVKMGLTSEAARGMAEQVLQSYGGVGDHSTMLQDFVELVLKYNKQTEQTGEVVKLEKRQSNKKHSPSVVWNPVDKALKNKESVREALEVAQLLKFPSEFLS